MHYNGDDNVASPHVNGQCVSSGVILLANNGILVVMHVTSPPGPVT